MRIRLPLLPILAVLAVALALVVAPDHARAGGSCSASTAMDSQENAFLDLINGYREQNGLDPLALSESLTRAAAWKSAHMADNDYFGHDDEGVGRDFVERLRDCGYGANTWLAENIAAGNDSAEEAFEQWRESPGHNANMVNQNMVAIGIARAFNSDSTYGWYWTTEFGGELDEPPPAPSPTPIPLPASLPDKTGDVNCTGDTTSVDAALVLQFTAGLVNNLPCGSEADVDGDGRTGSIDAAIILQISAGLFA